MKLLIFTQAVDRNDTALSFFHRWLEECAPHVESIHVICLKEGDHALPKNVTVHSLGKEGGRSRIKYLTRFYKYVWSLRHEYDAVFAHMNEEYLLLGGPLFRLMGKRVYLWRNFHAGTFLTDVAAFWCTKVFCTSKSSFTAKYKKTTLMPVGVDTNVFAFAGDATRTAHSILSLGRIAKEKRLDVLIEALADVQKEGAAFVAHIYGDALPEDMSYAESLKARVSELGLTDSILFHPGIPNDETPKVYQVHEIFVNLSPSGMYDKTIFEAALSGCLVLASSLDFKEHVDARLIFEDADSTTLKARITGLLALGASERTRLAHELRLFAESEHSLKALGVKLTEALTV